MPHSDDSDCKMLGTRLRRENVNFSLIRSKDYDPSSTLPTTLFLCHTKARPPIDKAVSYPEHNHHACSPLLISRYFPLSLNCVSLMDANTL